MFGNDFYPTPVALVEKMLTLVDMNSVTTILEPSAGRGDIIERLNSYRYDRKYDIDAIELDDELRSVLSAKGNAPVAKDFLTFKTFRQYDLVIMNPPFSDGEKHLTKALNLQKDGGQVVCLLNAETLKNAYTNDRKKLLERLDSLDAHIEYLQGEFANADRKTNVEVALVYVDIPQKATNSDILTNLIAAEDINELEESENSEIVGGSYIHQAVKRYQIETTAGLKFIDEYNALKKVLSRSFKDRKYSMIELVVDGDKWGENMKNRLVHRTRMKYWEELFKSSEFTRLFTESTRDSYHKRIEELGKYEFNEQNIRQMQIDISYSMIDTLDDSIIKLFDEFSNQYWDENSKNIHYYDGWKTNKSYVINKKVITRAQAYGYSGLYIKYGRVFDKLMDIHKVFSYLDGKLLNGQDEVIAALNNAQDTNIASNIELPYCFVTFYKKGTMHITFKDNDLLKKFNIIGSQKKGWLPPNYGKDMYSSMNSEEKAVIDSFEGKESYSDTYERREFYSLESSSRQLLIDG